MISNNLKNRIFTSLVLLLLVFLIINFDFILLYALTILGVLSILEFSQIIKKINKSRLSIFVFNIFFISYVSFFCIMFFLFSNLSGFKILLYIFLFGCIASDIGGFICGKIFKGPKLTKISPNKTYAGALGSIIFTLTIISILFSYFIGILNLQIILAGLATSLFCQFGDLLFSFLKRKAKLKDTGTFLPGHGGILDRLDGIFLGIPFGFLTLTLLN